MIVDTMLATNTIHLGNTLDLLRQLPDSSIDCCVSSPPYWSLRDYGSSATAIWDAKEGCEHSWTSHTQKWHSDRGNGKKKEVWDDKFQVEGTPSDTCSLCNAWKGQLGLEPDFKLYIKHLADIFDEVKRALKPTGTCWINLGDTYSGGKEGNTDEKNTQANTATFSKPSQAVPSKSLLQIPSRFAIEMSDRGWILRNKIIWHKKNCMPSSAKDRFTNDYEEIFFFVKSKKYYFEQQLEAMSNLTLNDKRIGKAHNTGGKYLEDSGPNGGTPVRNRILNSINPLGRNKRAVWRIATKPHPFAHFAVYPEELIETPIKAGCPEKVCDKCGKPMMTEQKRPPRPFVHRNKKDGDADLAIGGQYQKWLDANPPIMITKPSCSCNAPFQAGIVLDPFIGSGTTAIVAQRLNRRWMGFEINPEYLQIANKRLGAKLASYVER